ncbi:glutathione S transferase T1 [Cochliomyia hominivorax]
MSKLVKYYFDLMSQPSRALWIGLKMSKTPFEECPVALRRREQLTDEYKKVNRFQKVPALVDGDFHLSESIAMIRYLADKDLFSTDLYPKDLQYRARVDEFLEWQHLTVRAGCATYFLRCWLLPINGLAHMPSQEVIDKLIKEMEQHLKLVEKIWLKDGDFLTGKKLTVADLVGACEIEQTKLCKYDVAPKFPKVSDWLARVREESNPYYDEAHKFICKKSGL